MNQKKIAEIAKVAPSTVSKALSGSKEISTELAEKIKNIAIQEGYFDEKNKRKFQNNSKRNILIAVICPEIMGAYYSSIISNIVSEVEKRGGQVAIYTYGFDNNKIDNIVKMITMQNEVDGIISFSARCFKDSPNIPTVVITKEKRDLWCDTVCYCGSEIIEDAVDYLIKMGHRRIGFIGEKYTGGICQSFKKALAKKKLEVNEEFIFETKERFEKAGYVAAEEIFVKKERPTAVVAAYDEIGMGFIHRLKEKGMSVPKDISVIGINDVFYASFAQIPLTTIMVYKHQQAFEAVNLVYDKILNKTKEIKEVTTGHELIIRDTVKNIN